MNLKKCTQPRFCVQIHFIKIEFLNKIIISEKKSNYFCETWICYISGHIESKMIEQKENLMIFRPSKAFDWKERLSDISCEILRKRIF